MSIYFTDYFWENAIDENSYSERSSVEFERERAEAGAVLFGRNKVSENKMRNAV